MLQLWGGAHCTPWLSLMHAHGRRLGSRSTVFFQHFLVCGSHVSNRYCGVMGILHREIQLKLSVGCVLCVEFFCVQPLFAKHFRGSDSGNLPESQRWSIQIKLTSAQPTNVATDSELYKWAYSSANDEGTNHQVKIQKDRLLYYIAADIRKFYRRPRLREHFVLLTQLLPSQPFLHGFFGVLQQCHPGHFYGGHCAEIATASELLLFG